MAKGCLENPERTPERTEDIQVKNHLGGVHLARLGDNVLALTSQQGKPMNRPNCDHDKLVCPYAMWADEELPRLRAENEQLFLENGKLANTLGAECLRLRALLKHADDVVIWEHTPARAGFQEEIEEALGIGVEQSACPDHPTGRMVDDDGNRVCSTCGR